MTLQDSDDNRQAKTLAGDWIVGVHAVENLKDPVLVLRSNSNSIVFDAVHCHPLFNPPGNADRAFSIGVEVLDRVGKQVLEDTADLHGIAETTRQRLDRHRRTAILDPDFHSLCNLFNYIVHINVCDLELNATNQGQMLQCFKKIADLGSALLNAVDGFRDITS